MIPAAALPNIDEGQDDLLLVDVRKYGLDAGTSWWRRAYFRAIYLPFFRFSYNVVGIPAIGAVDKDGRANWVESITIATDAMTAKAMCLDEFYSVTAVPVNSALPRESAQYKAQVYERAEKPDRFNRRSFPLVPVRTLVEERRMTNELELQIDHLLARPRVALPQ